MNMHHPIVLALALCPLLAAAQETAVEAADIPEIRRNLDILSAQIKRLAEAQAATDQQSQAAYKAQLAALRKTMQEAGDLENVLAMDAETRRFNQALETGGDEFEEIPEMPRAALARAPAQLRAAQDAFTRRRQEASATRKTAVAALSQQFITRLDDSIRDFTKAGKIEDALAIRALRGRFQRAIETQSVESLAQSLLDPPRPQAPGGDPAADRAPWRQWRLAGNEPYSPDGMLRGAPGLPDDMTLEFAEAPGRGRAAGRAQTAPKTLDGLRREHFGRALQWEIAEPRHLNAILTLTPLATAPANAATPAAQVCVMDGATLLASVTAPLSASPMTFRLITPQDAARASIHCEQANPQTTAVNLPAGRPLTLLLGFFMGGPGESCDTSFAVE